MKHLLYVLGQPGSGKSTLVAGLTDGHPSIAHEKPFARIQWRPNTLGVYDGVWELGARRQKFSGTDALSMSVQPLVLDWLDADGPVLVLGEGDRLANSKFFRAALDRGYGLTLIYLRVSGPVADVRRRQRTAALGSLPQNPTWVKGRVSKMRKLGDEWQQYVLDVDADQRPAAVLDQVRAFTDVCPVVAALTSAP